MSLAARLTDFAEREVLYDYDNFGNLISVRTPIVTGTSTGNDFPNGRTERYEYYSASSDPRLQHNLRSVTAGGSRKATLTPHPQRAAAERRPRASIRS